MRSGICFALAAALLACGPPEPDASVACPVLTAQWEGGGHLRVLECRRTGGSRDAESGRYLMQLELDLEVLAKTQIYAAGPIVHRRGPEGSGASRPAGEVVTVEDELALVETDGGWEPER